MERYGEVKKFGKFWINYFLGFAVSLVRVRGIRVTGQRLFKKLNYFEELLYILEIMTKYRASPLCFTPFCLNTLKRRHENIFS